MTTQWPEPGPNLVGEYQISGLPYATSSVVTSTTDPLQIAFPFVTRFLTVTNTGTNYLGVGWTVNGIKGGDRFTLAPSGSYTGDWRVKDLYLLGIGGSCNFQVQAGLTMVRRKMFPTLTGSAAAGVLSASANSSDFGYGSPNPLTGLPSVCGLG